MSHIVATRHFAPATHPMEDWLRDCVDGLALSTRPGRHPGGEYDWLGRIPTRLKRRLTAAGYLAPDGAAPDVLADIASNRLARDMTVDDFCSWYLHTARLALDEGQRHRTHRRRLTLARRHGCHSYHAYRDLQARRHGWRSFWDMRRHRQHLGFGHTWKDAA